MEEAEDDGDPASRDITNEKFWKKKWETVLTIDTDREKLVEALGQKKVARIGIETRAA